MRVFLTGGAGFIGSWIAEKLVNEGYKVTIYDNFSSGSFENVKHLDGEVDIIEGDILDYQTLKISIKNHDVVIHHAAQLEITTAISDPVEDAKVNVMGSLNILKAMKELSISKGIFASSACVYGNIDKYLVQEDERLQPNWEYGVSKLAVEHYCDIFCIYENMNIASLRYSIVYGEREWYGRVLTIFLKRALEGKELVVFGDGTAVRDFIHVEDVANLNISLVKKNWKGHLVLNVSSSVATSIKDLAYIVKDVVWEEDKKQVSIISEKVQEGQFSKYIEGRLRLPRELRIMSLDNSRASKLLEWKPFISLKEGIRREYQWLKRNSHRWTKLSY